MNLKISFIILSWNSGKTIYDCLKSIKSLCEKENVDYEIFLTDNGSTDDTIEIINKTSQEIRINFTHLQKNLGTTVTRNDSIKKSSGDIVCILDSDAVLLEGNFNDISKILNEKTDIGIIAPKLIFSDGIVQNSVKKFPSVLGKFSRIPCIIFKMKLRHFDTYEEFPFDRPSEVDYAISACWFMKRSVFEEIGYLDERIFYAPEDIDYGLRIWKKGKKTLYYPNFTVLHHVQRITHKKFFSRIAVSHFLGLIYFFMKHRYFFKPGK